MAIHKYIDEGTVNNLSRLLLFCFSNFVAYIRKEKNIPEPSIMLRSSRAHLTDADVMSDENASTATKKHSNIFQLNRKRASVSGAN